jgi:hypothetical protein
MPAPPGLRAYLKKSELRVVSFVTVHKKGVQSLLFRIGPSWLPGGCLRSFAPAKKNGEDLLVIQAQSGGRGAIFEAGRLLLGWECLIGVSAQSDERMAWRASLSLKSKSFRAHRVRLQLT